jgi:hypothetical protein
MRPLISVVIPAHNPGRYIEPCIRSLLRQTLARTEFEVVFVDDGSTDGTGKRLDRLAREQPHVRVIHIPASGGPGRPRNVGLEAALGEYVQFLDADDELAPRALERLLRMARANRSDIVLGKFASETMTRRQDLFTRNRGATTLAETPKLAEGSLGPTKLFRTALLRDREISFPEGWRQMEDQLFTLQAYVAAEVISILGDEPCYFFNKREDEGHISSELVDPATHVAHLREILDQVDAGITDEALRQRFIARFYRTEMLGRLGGSQFLEAPPAYQEALFTGLRSLARERIGDVVRDGLGAFARIRSRLLLEGSLADLITLAERVAAFAVNARVVRAGWANGRLGIDFRATLSRGEDAAPLTLIKGNGNVVLDPAVADDLVGPVDVSDTLGSIRAQVSLVDRATALEWIVPSAAVLSMKAVRDANDHVRLPALVGFVELDPQRVGPGERPLDDGSWDVMIRWLGMGIQATGLLRLSRRDRDSEGPPIQPALVGRPVRWVVPGADGDGALRIAIGGPNRAPARIDDRARRSVRRRGRVDIELPVATDRSGQLIVGTVRLTGAAGTFEVPATVEGSLGSLVVSLDDVDGGEIPRGRYELTCHLGDPDAPSLPMGAALVREDGRVVVLGARPVSAISRARDIAAWWLRSTTGSGQARARAAFRYLPAPAKDVIRAAYRRLRD